MKKYWKNFVFVKKKVFWCLIVKIFFQFVLWQNLIKSAIFFNVPLSEKSYSNSSSDHPMVFSVAQVKYGRKILENIANFTMRWQRKRHKKKSLIKKNIFH